MGFLISPTLSNFVLQDLEIDIFNRINFDISAYFRYRNDTFLVIPKEKV